MKENTSTNGENKTNEENISINERKFLIQTKKIK
jgi:hypothetical protein